MKRSGRRLEGVRDKVKGWVCKGGGVIASITSFQLLA